MRKVKRIFIIFATVLTCAATCLSACKEPTVPNSGARDKVTVTVFNGEHYKVIGDNKRYVTRGESVSYGISVDEGYELISAFGKECEITQFKQNYSFVQTVTFPSVNYDANVTLSTAKLAITDFTVSSNSADCKIEIQSAAGLPRDGALYADDVISLYALPATGYRFLCWSTDGYISSGGKYYGDDRILPDFDFHSVPALYANFKTTADTARTIVYDFGSGIEIEQDCSAIVAHHYRANTLTEPDLIEKGYELPNDKLLVGWLTEGGEYVGLGCRTEVSDETYITLTPLWKDYTPEDRFTFSDGTVTGFNGVSESEVVVPKQIGGQAVTAIGENAFKDCKAGTYYLPNTVTGVAENAFLNCTALRDLYMSDSIYRISDASFRGCSNFTTLHLSAFLKPRFMTDYTSLKGDAIDRIIAQKDRKKCVIIGGSSVSHAYNVRLSEELLKEQYYIYNLGYHMAMCTYAYYDIIDTYLNEGDIYIHAPEQNDRSWCGDAHYSALTGEPSFSITQPFLFYICEGDWQVLEGMNIKRYHDFFNQFSYVNIVRHGRTPLEYYDHFYASPEGVSDGILASGEIIIPGCGEKNKNFGLNGNLAFDTHPSLIDNTNYHIFKPLINKGVHVCCAFPPMNRHNLLNTYGNEENMKAAALEYTQTLKSNVSDRVNVILTQYDTVYDGELFANTDYHIGYPARNGHTTKIISAVAEALHL